MRQMMRLRSGKRQPSRPDPAPSRIAYRLNRLWLTPEFRQIVRFGIPLGICLALVFAWVSKPGRINELRDYFAEMRRSIEERPEFMVNAMRVEGASPVLRRQVREILAVDLPLSSFNFDLEQMRQSVMGLDPVKDAELRIKAGGILEVKLTERLPVMIWRGRDGYELLDVEGYRVAGLRHRTDRPDLPLIAGEGGEDAVPEALDILANVHPIRHRILGLVRISERRWDIVLDGDQRVMLPAENALPALDRVLALNEAQDLLSRNVTHVDFRNPRRPTLRMSAAAVSDLRQLKGLEIKEDQQ